MKTVKAMPFFAMGTLALGLVGVTVLAPVANAESTTFTQKVSVEVEQHLGVTATQTELKSDKGQDVTSNLNVTCNVANGFKLTLSDKDEDTSLRLDGKADGAEIKTADTLGTVGWNVTTNGVTKAIPAKALDNANALLMKETAKSGNETAEAIFHFKTDSTVQAGTYSDEVEYTLVANPAAAPAVTPAPAHHGKGIDQTPRQ